MVLPKYALWLAQKSFTTLSNQSWLCSSHFSVLQAICMYLLWVLVASLWYFPFSDWPFRLLWFWFHSTQLKSALSNIAIKQVHRDFVALVLDLVRFLLLCFLAFPIKTKTEKTNLIPERHLPKKWDAYMRKEKNSDLIKFLTDDNINRYCFLLINYVPHQGRQLSNIIHAHAKAKLCHNLFLDKIL